MNRSARPRTLAAAGLAALALALAACGDSPEDDARDDGEQVGEAVRGLADARSIGDVQAAADEVRSAIEEIESDTRDEVRAQIETQRGAVQAAVDSLRNARSFDDARVALAVTAQDLRAQAEAFRESGENSIANEFWRGFGDGYDGD